MNESLVNDVSNLFAKGKSIGANSARFGFINYRIDMQVTVNMIADMLKLKKKQILQQHKGRLGIFLSINLQIKVGIKNGERNSFSVKNEDQRLSILIYKGLKALVIKVTTTHAASSRRCIFLLRKVGNDAFSGEHHACN